MYRVRACVYASLVYVSEIDESLERGKISHLINGNSTNITSLYVTKQDLGMPIRQFRPKGEHG